MLAHDEIRVANWSEAAYRAGDSPGKLLAENFRRTVEVVRRQSPQVRLCVWSDMFDPHHNARNNFYLVCGDLAGSWGGLSSDVTIINWNHVGAKESLPFFGGRGHQQIPAGYYDSNPARIRDWQAQAKPADGVDGVMSTTWRNRDDDLEASCNCDR